MPRSVTECLAPAFEHTGRQLFSPLRLSQWWRLAVVGLLAGANAQGGGCRFGFPGFPSSPSTATRHQSPPTWPELPSAATVMGTLVHYAWIIGLVIVAFVVLGVVMLAISSAFRFMLYQSVVERHCQIRPSWRRWRAEGRRLFFWQLGFSAVILTAMLLAAAIPAGIVYSLGWFDDPAAHVPEFIVLGVSLVPVMILLLLASGIVRVLVNDFAVPVMALEGVGVVDAWRRVRATIAPHRGELAIYVLVKVIMAIAVAIAAMVVSIPILLALVFVSAIVIVIALAVAMALGIGWNIFTVTVAVLAGLTFLSVLMSFTALLSVPVTVFLTAFSIYYVADRYPPLAMWLSPPTPGTALLET